LDAAAQASASSGGCRTDFKHAVLCSPPFRAQLDDIVGNEPIVERLKIIAEEGNMNNMILAVRELNEDLSAALTSGSHASGYAHSMLTGASWYWQDDECAVPCAGPFGRVHEGRGPRAQRQRRQVSAGLWWYAGRGCVVDAPSRSSAPHHRLLPATLRRGIDVVRNKIKTFAQKKVTLPPGRHKIIILDEADSMTASAQQALRRTMEVFSSTTRFAMACNNSTKIIEPIQSRCAVLRYSRISDFEVVKRLKEVCEAETVPSDEDGMEAILFTSEGDMRQALNNLQSTFAGFGRVTGENVMRVCDQPHPMTVRTIVDGAVTGDLDASLA